MKKIVSVLLTVVLALSCCAFAAGCESKEEKELREVKQQQIDLLNHKIQTAWAPRYDGNRPCVEYYEYYLSDMQKKTVEQLENAATKEEVLEIAYDAFDEIRSVSSYYNQIMGFSVRNSELSSKIIEYDDGDVSISLGQFAMPTGLSSVPSWPAIRVTLSAGVSAKVFFDNGLTFCTPQTDETFPPYSCAGGNLGTVSSPFSVSADDSEESYIFIYDTTDPIVYKWNSNKPSYNEDHDFCFSIVFEKDGYVTGYCAYNYLDETTYKYKRIKTIVYGENFRHQVTEEKALYYIELAKQGVDGEAADGIDYAEMGRLFVADMKNYYDFVAYYTYMKNRDTIQYFEIIYENSPNKIRIALPKNTAEFTLSTQEGEFTLHGVTSKTISPGIGDVVIYKNESGKIDFISGILQPSVYYSKPDAEEDSVIYNNMFCVFAVYPDGTKPYASGSLAYKTLALKGLLYQGSLEKEGMMKIFTAITDSAIKYHESEFLGI